MEHCVSPCPSDPSLHRADSNRQNRHPAVALRLHRLAPVFLLSFGALFLLLFWGLSGRPLKLWAAGSTVRYVAPSPLGSDNGGANTCANPIYPCATIQQAVIQASSNDEIRVAAGTFTDTVNLNKNLTLRGGFTTTNWIVPDPLQNRTTIDAQAAPASTQRALYVPAGVAVTVNGFYLTGGRTNGADGAGVYNEGTLTLENCLIYGNRAEGDGSDGGGVANEVGATLVIRRCQIYSNTAAQYGGGLHVQGGVITVEASQVFSNSATSYGGGTTLYDGNMVLRNSLIYTNTTGANGGGIAVNQGVLQVENNTLYGNRSTGSGGGLYASGGVVVVTNTLIVSNTGASNGGIDRGSATVNVSYTDFFGNAPDNGDTTGAGNRTGQNPLFINPAAGNLHIASTSPARDTGAALASIFTDFEGEGRPFGSSIDRGADEYTAPGACYARLSSGKVYTNVQQAIDAAAPGGLVQVAGVCNDVQLRAGSYQVAYISKTLTLRGGYTVTDWLLPQYGPTVLDAHSVFQSHVLLLAGTASIAPTIENLFIVGGNANGSGSAANGGGVYVGSNAHVVLQNVVLYNNTAVLYGGGIYVQGGSQATIRHATIYDNDASGGGASGGGIYAASASTVQLNSSIVATNTASSGGSGIDQGGASVSLGYNDFFNNTYGTVTPGTTDLAFAPGFVDQASLNLRLAFAASRLINAADPASTVATDIENHPRPLGNGADIGAYENLWYTELVLGEDPLGPRLITDPATVLGKWITFTHSITNVSSAPVSLETVSLSWHNSHDWPVVLSGIATTFVLTRGESLTFAIAVSVPSTAPTPFYNQTWVTATSQDHLSSFDAVADVIATPRVELAPSFTENADPGELITYTHVLTNAGPIADTFAIYFNSSLGWGQMVSPTSLITLAGGASTQIQVRVEVTTSAPANLADVVTLRASSTTFSGVEAQVQDTTIANPTTGNRYVTSGGTNTNNNCTQQNTPCGTIAYAFTQAAGGDEVRVAQGIYYEANIFINQQVSLRGGYTFDGSAFARPEPIDPALTIVDAGHLGRGLRIQIPSNTPVVVEGLTIMNGTSSGVGGGVYIQSTSAPTLTKLIVLNSTATYGGGIYLDTGNAILKNVTVSNTAATVLGGGIYINGGLPSLDGCRVFSATAPSGGGMYIQAGTVALQNSFVYSSTATANGGGIYNNATLRAANNTLYANRATNSGGALFAPAGSSTVLSNTIVVKNTAATGGGAYLLGSAAADYNNFWGNTASLYADSNAPTGAHSMATDPLFVNADGHDLHLRVDSPCIDRADPYTTLEYDFEDDMRPVNQGYDIGADEVAGCLARVVDTNKVQVGPIYGMLQEAVDAATPGFTVQIAGICRGVAARLGISQTVMITKHLILDGGYNGTFSAQDPAIYTTTLDATGLGRTVVVTGVTSGQPVTLSNLILTGGNAAGLGGGPGGSNAGGGIYLAGSSAVLGLENCIVIANQASYGGGIYNANGTLYVSDNKFQRTRVIQNTALYGGGLYNPSGATSVLDRSVFYANIAANQGGSIYNAGTLTLFNTFIISSTAQSGGGLYNTSVNLAVRHDTLFGNQATSQGGGIYHNTASTVPVINSVILVSNTASSGGGIYTAQTTDPQFNYNDVYGNAGGNYGGNLAAGDGVGNIAVYPDFVSLFPTDTLFLRIASGSPVEDVADPSSPVEYDVDREPRPSNQGFDIGADEVGGCYVRNARLNRVYASIQLAVNESNSGDLLQLAGTCRGVNTRSDGGQTVRQAVFLNKSLTLEGGHTAEDWGLEPDPVAYPTTLDALNLGRVAYITSSARVSITYLTMINGRATSGGSTNGGAILLANGTLSMTQNAVYSSTATNGGALYVMSGTAYIVMDNQFVSNTATAGGAVYQISGQLTLDDNQLRGNVATDGSAVYHAGGTLTVTNNILLFNRASGNGGIYHPAIAAPLRVWHNTFYSNTATNGAGLYTVNAVPSIVNNIFATHTVTALGYAVYGPAGLTVDYNDAYPGANAYGGGVTAGSHSLAVDPLFMDMAGGDFHLQETSPVLDRGNPDMTLLVDFEEDMRPGHQGFDMGADEIPGCRARIVRTGVIYGNPQWAIYNSLPGDVIQVTNDRECGGVHSYNPGSGAINQTIHITHALTIYGGYDILFTYVGDPTIFDAHNLGRVAYMGTSSAITIGNVKLQNGSAVGLGGGPGNADAGGALYNTSNALVLTQTAMFTSTAAYGGGLYNPAGKVANLDRNVQFGKNIASSDGGGLYNLGTLNAWNTAFYSNTAVNGGGLYNAGTAVLWHDVFYQNLASTNGGGVYAAGASNNIQNSAFAYNVAANGSAIYGSAATVDYNDYYNNVPATPVAGGIVSGSHSLQAEPSFVAPGLLDFHLNRGSLLIDAGQDLGVATDMDGDVRPTNTAPDIGMDEFTECMVKNARTNTLYGRIQPAIDEAAPGDTLRIGGWVTLWKANIGICLEHITINKDLTLSGNWNQDDLLSSAQHNPLEDDIYTIIQAPDAGRVVTISGGADVQFEWLIIRGGDAGSSDGGGIWSQAQRLTLSYMKILSNSARNGGGIYVSAGAKLDIGKSTIYSNVATLNGGGIYHAANVTSTIWDTGIGYAWPSLDIYWGNRAGNQGGGIYNSPGDKVHVTGGDFIMWNHAASGGGIYNNGATLTIYNKSLDNNHATGDGGGLYLTNGSLADLTNTRFYSNSADGNGGGLYRNDASGQALLAHDTIYSNTALSAGGGVYNAGSSMVISASIVASNTAPSGSGINGASTVYVRYTLRWQNAYSGVSEGAGNLVADPHFHPVYNGIALLFDSPAIDAVPDAVSAVIEDCSRDPREEPLPENFTRLCAKDMGMDEFITAPALDAAPDGPTTAVLNPTETFTFTFVVTNTSLNWYKVIYPSDQRGSFGFGSGYTETVAITIADTYPGWSKLVGAIITAAEGIPYVGSPAVTMAGNTASFDLRPGYRATISVAVTVPPSITADIKNETWIEYVARIGACAGGTSINGNTPRITTNAIEDRSFIIAPDHFGAALPGQTITYTHVLTNLGNITDTFTIYPKAGFYAVGQVALPITGSVELAPGMTQTVILSVTINREAAGGLVDVTSVIARNSVGDERAASNNTAISYTTGTRYVSLEGQDSLVDETDGNPDPDAINYDDNNCTQPNVGACRTIQHAIDQAAPGDLIKIEGGAGAASVYTDVHTTTYQSQVIYQIAFINESVTLQGGYDRRNWNENPPSHITHTTILDPLGDGRAIYVAQGVTVTIDRLFIQNGNATAAGFNGLGGNLYNDGSNLTLSADQVYDGLATQGGGLYSNGGTLTVTNSILRDNQASDLGGAIYVTGTAALLNNTLYRNQAANGGSALYIANGRLDITNTIVATNTGSGGAIHGAPMAASLAYNLYFGNTASNTGGTVPAPGSTDRLNDPLFVLPGNDPPDLHIQVTSPARDSGTAVALNIDFENDFRPLGSGYDIGADERVPQQSLILTPSTFVAAVAGQTVVISHTLYNNSEISDTITLDAASSRGIAEGWSLVVSPALGAPFPITVGGQISVIVTCTAPITANGLTNIIWLTATSSANPAVSSAVRDEIKVQSPAWQIAKHVQPTGTVEPGSYLTYTLTITNIGDLSTSGNYTVSDQLPADTHFVSASGGGTLVDQTVRWISNTPVPTGTAFSVTLVVTVSKPLTDGAIIANQTYSITGGGAYTPAIGSPVTNIVYAAANLSIAKVESDDPVQPGDWLTYTLTIVNQASASASAMNVVITDTLPGNVIYQSMGFAAPATGATSQVGGQLQWQLSDPIPVGGSVQVTAAVRVTSPLTNGTVLTNTAQVTASNAVAAASVSVTTTVSASNVITLSKTVQPAIVGPGSTVTFTIVLTNSGAGVANVALADLLDPAFTPKTWNANVIVPGHTWSSSAGTTTVSFVATAPVTGGDYYNRWLTATYDLEQLVLSNVAPVKVQQPISGLTLTNSSPTVLGTATVFTFSIASGNDVTFALSYGNGTPLVTGILTPGVPVILAYTYPVPGTYTAIITASNGASTQVVTTMVRIETPIAGLTALNSSPTPQSIATWLTATVTAGDNIVYTWSMGDGSTASGANVTHIYPDVGVYTAIVTAANSVSQMTATTIITITDAPVGGLVATNSGPTQVGYITWLTATVTSGENVTYTWDMGDGSGVRYGQMVTYLYPDVGAYTATVTASNNVNTITATTVVLVEQPVSGLTAEAENPNMVGMPVTLTARLSSGNYVTYTINWGDGTIDTGIMIAGTPMSITHTYLVSGTFTAIVTTSNHISTISTTVEIVVEELISGLALANDSPTPLGRQTHLTATVSTGSHIIYVWDFGDGDGATGLNAAETHVYPAMGMFTATVTARNSFGQAVASTYVTIIPPVVGLSAASYSVAENDGAAIITVSLSAAASAAVTVDYATSSGTATMDSDYSAAAGTLIFAPGQVTQTFTVPIIDDALYEPAETVLLTLQNATGAILDISQATLTIVDNDGVPSVQFSQQTYTVGEASGSASIDVTLSHASVETITVQYASSDGTAIAGSDYTAVSGMLTFIPGETSHTFSVPILDDSSQDPNETVNLTLSDAVGALISRPNVATLTIVDDEPPPTMFAFLPVVFKTYSGVSGPINRDLIVESIQVVSAHPTVIQVTVRNIGSRSVPYNFWVDLYVDPNPPPQGFGDLWDPPRCTYGGAWLVQTEVPAFGTVTVNTTQFSSSYSIWPRNLPSGTHVLYAQVDAYSGTHGMVDEDNEGNNLLGPVNIEIP